MSSLGDMYAPIAGMREQMMAQQAPDYASLHAMRAQMMAQMQNAQNAHANEVVTKRKQVSVRAEELFVNRLIGVEGVGYRRVESDFIKAFLYDGKIYLFFLINGKEGVVNEPVGMFPSDQLIAQFRMILS